MAKYEVTEILATEVYVECLKCDERVEGWCVDPRGHEGECDSCGTKFKVHKEADFDMR